MSADNILRRLEHIAANAEGVLRQAIAQSAEVIAADARALAPVGKHTQGANSGALTLSGSIDVSMDGTGAKITCHAPHGVYVEFGTGRAGAAHHEGTSPTAAPKYTSGGWVYPYWGEDGQAFAYTEGQPARPFMYPAAVQNREGTVEAVREAVETLLKGG